MTLLYWTCLSLRITAAIVLLWVVSAHAHWSVTALLTLLVINAVGDAYLSERRRAQFINDVLDAIDAHDAEAELTEAAQHIVRQAFVSTTAPKPTALYYWAEPGTDRSQ